MILSNSLITKYLPADYKDCFWEKITDKPHISVKKLFDSMFIQYPKWALWLLKLRDFIVKPLGIKASKSFKELIREENSHEIILGTKDKHLTFYVSISCIETRCNEQIASITTLVKYNNILGKMYFVAIWVFHKFIVHKMLKRAIRKCDK
ncbi:DUF2867 domain-containing protein [Lepagella muris]|jgi:hypothetical protein|uniref:DUF2867 domain-containing protein n=1 Tax=Lepagella muris TaxID=3032870 RepID=A0AC61RGP4_9BACT|nr:DUF2867 domain-containing protein [Lepagella muris]ROT05052.1 DUF2867 domain-containing protein [Muribaculaceae bacterium Isolate-037 (Harlan)]TGY78541.1 DUF2867 domain-containing protein [Lepagella muris]THG51995.1 DUF2867 domain-containing protein [Bacteroidales bacterium]TKC54890.1 DUF2867 domain-containing protein [Bacteroidales bacterium]